MKKKTIALLLVLMLVFGVTCGGTIAYLTSTTDTITNTFTVGKVAITLDEALVDEYGALKKGEETVRIPNKDEAYKDFDGNEYKLIPGHSYKKDPIVHVLPDSEACYVFVKVENGIASIEADNNKIAAQIATTNGWKQLMNGETPVENVYYREQAAVEKDADVVNLPVFSGFTLKADADVAQYTATGAKLPEVKITAYAVQADGMNGAYDAWDKAGFGK